MSDLTSLEYPTLKLPYEILNKKYRAVQKSIDREVSHVQKAAVEIENKIQKQPLRKENVTQLLGEMVGKLNMLKRKAEEGVADELQEANVCKRRIEHLKDYKKEKSTPSLTEAATNSWRKQRMDRILVEHFLRNGYYKSAICLAEKSDIKDLTNIDIFLASSEVEKNLSDHKTNKCLQWCIENRSKLRKLKSTIEFNVRLQDFIELIRSDRRMEAIKHARKYFTGFEGDHLTKVQQVMGLLAFPVDTDIAQYKSLYDFKRWDTLREQFRQENYRLYQLSSQSVFTVVMEAGLSALKTPNCYVTNWDDRNPSCPVCQNFFNELAIDMPFAHCSQSKLYCQLSGAPLNENNQPMMLPNGYIYGEKALKEMSRDNNGKITCPKTKETFPYKNVVKVYVM